jgi:hypothetical protein
MRTVNNHKQLLIGKADPSSTVTPLSIYDDPSSTATIATPATLADGEIVFTREDGAVVSSGTTGIANLDRLYAVQGQGADKPLIKSALIYKAGITTKRGLLFDAGAQQVDYIGFNGGTGLGSIDPINNNPYIVRASLKTNFYQFSDKEMHVIGDYVSDGSATQLKVATGLTKSLIANSEKYVNIPFRIERVSDGTFTAFANNVTVAKGSKTLTGNAADIATLTVGDVLRIGGTGNDSPVYVVTALPTATTATLDIAWQDSTVTTVLAANVGVMTVVTAYGVKLTGLPQAKFRAGVFRYEKSKWLTTLQNGGSTEVTSPYVVANEGSGLYEQIAEDEWFFQLGEGFADSNTIQIPPVEFRKNVELTGTYSCIDLEWKDIAGGTDILLNPTVFKQLKLAINDATRVDQLDTVADTIEAWLGGTII